MKCQLIFQKLKPNLFLKVHFMALTHQKVLFKREKVDLD